jgi:hypothetical protein
MNFTDLIWIPAFLLVLYAPCACYWDLKQREIPTGFWTLLWTVCIPVTILLYAVDVYPIEGLIVSGFCISFYLIAGLKGCFSGADFWYLTAISLFLVTNPVSGHSLMAATYLIFLVVSIVGFALLYQTKVLNKYLGDKPGFPFMLQISFALILTVVLG